MHPNPFPAIPGILYADLRDGSGLQRLDELFVDYISQLDAPLLSCLERLRDHRELSRDQHSLIIMQLAPHLEAFWVKQLGYEELMAPYKQTQAQHQVLMRFKKEYLLRRIKPRLSRLDQGNFQLLSQELFSACDASHDNWEYPLASWALNNTDSSLLETWCGTACLSDEGKAFVSGSILFDWPKRHEGELLALDDEQGLSTQHCSHREGFDAQDKGLTALEQQDHAHYCLYCQEKSGDFCSIGFPVKKGDFSQGYRSHLTGEAMLGCPLEEHVGEMHQLFAAGHPIAALAAAMVNNPMIALTGHRVCNDCMKSCVYQKQTPVNTPAVESGVLQTVLNLPWGVELLDLMMRWNPLRQWQPIEKADQGYRVAVMGLGPAGIASMHHLLMAGCSVVGFDGTRLLPVPDEWCDTPIRDYQMLCEPLSQRPARGFGGVSEYGITVRWDKNLLTLLHVLFQRHPRVRLLGSVRFGGTLTVSDFWPMGFDHLCLALGAGLPKELRIPNSLAIGMRQASDFLMSLQLTEASREEALGLFSMRLPVLVIGGGLTAVDAATEAGAYYLQLIQTVQKRYLEASRHVGEDNLRAHWEPQEAAIIDEWLMHAKAWQEAKKTGVSSTDFIRRYGGVSIVYRRRMHHSPAYRRNHEELQECLNVGVHYREALQPVSVLCDEVGHVSGLRCDVVTQNEAGYLVSSGESIELPAKCILSATGSKPNVAYEFEHRGTFKKRDGHYAPYFLKEGALVDDTSQGHFKADNIGMLTSYDYDGRRVSLVGDAHWRYNGTVVQAIASARHALPQIMVSMSKPSHASIDLSSFQTQVLSNNTLMPGCQLLTIRCPQLAKQHLAGQFYRVASCDRSRVIAEGVPLLGSRLAPEGCLSFVLVGDDPSVTMLKALEAGDACDVMGPTGAWSRQPGSSERILVMGDALAFAFLRSLLPEWDSEVHDIIWCAEDASLKDHLPSSIQVVSELPYDCRDISTVFVIGEPDYVREVRRRRASDWMGRFAEGCRWVGAVYGPMQCQLKGVCAQCLQWQIDPKTGERVKAVYACSWQHQPMDLIDMEHLSMRSVQSRALDQLTRVWYDASITPPGSC